MFLFLTGEFCNMGGSNLYNKINNNFKLNFLLVMGMKSGFSENPPNSDFRFQARNSPV